MRASPRSGADRPRRAADRRRRSGPASRSSAARTLEDAVAARRALAQPGDAVLLSPACASFDMFRNYKHRGDVFAAAVQGARET